MKILVRKAGVAAAADESCRHGFLIDESLNNPGALIVSKHGGLVHIDRLARRETELILAKLPFFEPSHIAEEVRRVEFVVAEKFPHIAVILVCSTFQSDIQCSPARAPKPGVAVGSFHFEFSDGVHRG